MFWKVRLIIKTEELATKARLLFGDSVNIKVEGKRHLGAVIGSAEYKDHYCTDMIDKWMKELDVLCNIAETFPQCALKFSKLF